MHWALLLATGGLLITSTYVRPSQDGSKGNRNPSFPHGVYKGSEEGFITVFANFTNSSANLHVTLAGDQTIICNDQNYEIDFGDIIFEKQSCFKKVTKKFQVNPVLEFNNENNSIRVFDDVYHEYDFFLYSTTGTESPDAAPTNTGDGNGPYYNNMNSEFWDVM